MVKKMQEDFDKMHRMSSGMNRISSKFHLIILPAFRSFCVKTRKAEIKTGLTRTTGMNPAHPVNPVSIWMCGKG
jgi:hypothetical protein